MVSSIDFLGALASVGPEVTGPTPDSATSLILSREFD
jgi:hypothetical protein